jgi:hypothetical protein
VVPIGLQSHTREHDHTDRLIEGDPVLDPISKLFETESYVVLEIGQDVPRRPSSVTFLETGGEVPMEEGNKGGDPVGQEGVDELVVIGDPCRVDGIVLATCVMREERARYEVSLRAIRRTSLRSIRRTLP